MSSNLKPVVTSQMKYDKISSTIPAKSSEKYFTPTNGTTFDYRGTQQITVRIAVSEANSMADFRHAYLKANVTNPNTYDIYYDNLASSICNRFMITCGGVTMQDDTDYNVRIQSFLDYYGSDTFNRELSITSAHPNVAFNVNGSYDLSSNAAINYGTNLIKAGQTKTIAIPIISDFLTQRLLPICLMGSSYLELHFFLEDPRRAFLINGDWLPTNAGVLAHRRIPEADANNISYSVKNVEVCCNIISVLDNSLISTLAQQMESEGLFVCGKVWTTYRTIIPASNESTVNFSIPDKSASMTAVVNAMCLSQPSPYISNTMPSMFGATGHYVSIGADMFPKKPIEYNTNQNTSLLQAYFNLLKINSYGYFNTENHTSIDIDSFSRQCPHNLLDFGTSPARNRLNPSEQNVLIKPSSFLQGISFASFDNISHTAECGISTRALNLPMTFNITRDINTYFDAGSRLLHTDANGLDGINNADVNNPISACALFPMITCYTFVCSDVIWRLGASGFSVDK